MVWEHQQRYLIIVVYAELELRSQIWSRDRDSRVIKVRKEIEAIKWLSFPDFYLPLIY